MEKWKSKIRIPTFPLHGFLFSQIQSEGGLAADRWLIPFKQPMNMNPAHRVAPSLASSGFQLASWLLTVVAPVAPMSALQPLPDTFG
jgi:hypothetical protein